MIDPGLTSKVALVTGAHNPRGIGAAIAEALAAQGAAVFVTDAPRSASSDSANVALARWVTGQRIFVGGGHRI